MASMYLFLIQVIVGDVIYLENCGVDKSSLHLYALYLVKFQTAVG